MGKRLWILLALAICAGLHTAQDKDPLSLSEKFSAAAGFSSFSAVGDFADAATFAAGYPLELSDKMTLTSLLGGGAIVHLKKNVSYEKPVLLLGAGASRRERSGRDSSFPFGELLYYIGRHVVRVGAAAEANVVPKL